MEGLPGGGAFPGLVAAQVDFAVAANHPAGQRPLDLQAFRHLRTSGVIASLDIAIHSLVAGVFQHGSQRRQIAVDVREHSQAGHGEYYIV